MKKAVIYPGRFQPMLPHHEIVYKKLQAEFPDADVYIATSDKVEGSKSPFNFKEKAEIMSQMFDIPVDKIILAPQPYLIDSYKTKLDMENTMVIFAVGEKDTDRFPMNNVDEKTGLDMTVRGETRPKYYQMINTLKQHPALPMSERGYIHIAPTVKGGDEVASASAFRKAFTSVEDVEKRKDIFQQYLGSYNEKVFKLFNNKLIGEQMSEMIDVMKYLAGLTEAAPIQFGDLDVDTGMTDSDEDDYATKPGFEQDSMINQLGKIIDSEEAGKDAEDMKIKNFKPVTSVKTDDGKEVDISPEEAKALKKMMDMLPSNRGGEEQSPREKYLDAIQNSEGLANMLDFAKSKNLVDEDIEKVEMPTVDLSDIKSDYSVDVEEDDDYDDYEPMGPTPSEMEDEELMDYVGQKEEDLIDDIQEYIAPDFLHKDNYDEMFMKYREEVLEPAADELNRDKAMDSMAGESIEEGRLKDVIIDVLQMDKEEFDKVYKGMFDYDELSKQYDENNPEYEEQPEPDLESLEELRKLAGLPETVRSMDDMSDEEKEDFEKRSADPDSLTGSPMKVFKNLVKQEIGRPLAKRGKDIHDKIKSALGSK
jgi:hypothetical protein